MLDFDLQGIEQRRKEGKHTTIDMLMLIEKAIEQQGSAAGFGLPFLFVHAPAK
ncbi:MAG: hypothetical protein IJ416_02775 [Ruminiclostridium sp.]|nr:hypothetical protein [Ruminiclostridium sp.]